MKHFYYSLITLIFSIYLILCACSAKLGTLDTNKANFEEASMISAKLINEYGEIQGGFVSLYLTDLTQRLTHNISTPNSLGIQYQISLLDTLQTMAYSPGAGMLLISRGLVLRLDAESELAFVVAHEIAHQELGHVLHRNVPDFNPAIDRELEIQADKFALRLMSVSGYDPRKSVEALTHAYQTGMPPQAVTLSHPELKTRIAILQNTMPPTSAFNIISRRDYAKFKAML